jgi:hypothetical protein
MDSEQKNLSPKCSDGSRIEASGNRSAIASRDGFNLSPAPGTGLESPETASQNLRYLAARPSTVTVRRGFLPARQIRLARDQWDTRAGKISGHNRVGGNVIRDPLSIRLGTHNVCAALGSGCPVTRQHGDVGVREALNVQPTRRPLLHRSLRTALRPSAAGLDA